MDTENIGRRMKRQITRDVVFFSSICVNLTNDKGKIIYKKNLESEQFLVLNKLEKIFPKI